MSQRVNSTHAWRGRRLRLSEISSSGDVGFWVRTTRLDVMKLAAADLTLAAASQEPVEGLLWILAQVF